MTSREQVLHQCRRLKMGLVAVGLAIGVLGFYVLLPYFQASRVAATESKPRLPAYDCSIWHSLAVQHAGRQKPFESAAVEILREVTGRSKFEGNKAVNVVLSWMLMNGSTGQKSSLAENSASTGFTDWEHYPFILCDHHVLRRTIFQDKLGKDAELTEDHLHGKYVSPADLRSSEGIKKLLSETKALRAKFGNDKYTQHMNPEQRKAEEAARRLSTFDNVSQNQLPGASHLVGPLWADQLQFGVDPMLNAAFGTPFMSLQSRAARGMAEKLQQDPFHFVGLDLVRNSAWFSMGELQACFVDSARWREIMLERLARTPQHYLSPDRKHALESFQEQIKAGTVDSVLQELDATLPKLSEQRIQEFVKRNAGSDTISPEALVRDDLMLGLSMGEWRRVADRLRTFIGEKGDIRVSMVANIVRETLDQRDQSSLEGLRRQVQQARAGGYHPDDPRFRVLHLTYLECRYPDVYRESVDWQPFPADRAKEVLASYDTLRSAYGSGDAQQFQTASLGFFDTIQAVSDRALIDSYAKSNVPEIQQAYAKAQAALQSGNSKQANNATETFLQTVNGLAKSADERAFAYPGEDTGELEMQFNRTQPFMWAWIIMLLSLLLFIGSMATDSKITYLLGFAAYLTSLGFQVFGFYARVAIAGRPPVSNMYETVVWVAFMSGIFALVLELVYRKKVIALAGAMVSTLGLVLADQLPMALDPKISPLTPVLRSNYWLIIHVLTIVSSYAGGTLAWGLGNVTLALLAFQKRPNRELLKTLSTFTYRAIQIAVLLLAAGTFLGGWWAAESWGRFWGWDPKEVWALIALVCYVIPLHARFIGWVKDFGLAVCAVVCYSAIVMAWYGVNFVLGAGLHSYGFGGGGPWWVFLAGLVNLELVLFFSLRYLQRQVASATKLEAAALSV